MKKREKILRRRYLVKRREREREYYYCEEDIPQTPEGLKPSATLSPKDRPKEKKNCLVRTGPILAGDLCFYQAHLGSRLIKYTKYNRIA